MMPLIALVIFIILAVGWWFYVCVVECSSERKGERGESILTLALGDLDPKLYHVMNDVLLPDGFPSGQGTTQIDHIVFSPFGIFVVETKNYSGWIFGNPKSAKWCQCFYGKRFYFQNPYRQNYKHVCCLSQLTGLNKDAFIQVIAFVGPCTVKTRDVLPPSFVVSQAELETFIHSHRIPRISDALLLQAENAIRKAQIENTPDAKENHISRVRGKCYNYVESRY